MKNEELETFLQNLTDKEFAFFYRFRRFEFMKESTEKVEREKAKRNLTDIQIKNLQHFSITNDERCMRCQSQNFQPIVDIKLITQSYTAYEVAYHSRKCRICGYNSFKDKPLNLKIRWNRFRGKYHWKKLV